MFDYLSFNRHVVFAIDRENAVMYELQRKLRQNYLGDFGHELFTLEGLPLRAGIAARLG